MTRWDRLVQLWQEWREAGKQKEWMFLVTNEDGVRIRTAKSNVMEHSRREMEEIYDGKALYIGTKGDEVINLIEYRTRWGDGDVDPSDNGHLLDVDKDDWPV
jgi:hypothetical protein